MANNPLEEARLVADKARLELERLERLQAAYPDMQKHVNRWKTVRYYSAMVNTVVNDLEIRHSCGCCPDAACEVWPFLETPNGRVYTDPPRFSVGERSWTGRDRPDPNWEEALYKAQIPELLIQRVRDHFGDAEETSEIPDP